MKSKHQNFLAWRKSKGCAIDCKINLNLLFQEKEERKRFDAKWKDFIASDPDNTKAYRKRGNKLIYRSEQLIPTKRDNRLPLLMVFGNPATHSVEAGMFFSFNMERGQIYSCLMFTADLSFAIRFPIAGEDLGPHRAIIRGHQCCHLHGPQQEIREGTGQVSQTAGRTPDL